MSDKVEIREIILDLVKRAVESYVRDGTIISVPRELPEELLEQKATFVCIKTEAGNLRGCIGTVVPITSNLAKEIIQNAVAAASSDYRFGPIESKELGELNFSVDILSDLELVSDIEELDPKKYGVYIKSGSATGLLLPDLDGVDSAEKQLTIAKQKAGLGEEDNIQVYRFTVVRNE